MLQPQDYMCRQANAASMCVCVCVCAHASACVCVFMHACVCVCVYACVSINSFAVYYIFNLVPLPSNTAMPVRFVIMMLVRYVSVPVYCICIIAFVLYCDAVHIVAFETWANLSELDKFTWM